MEIAHIYVHDSKRLIKVQSKLMMVSTMTNILTMRIRITIVPQGDSDVWSLLLAYLSLNNFDHRCLCYFVEITKHFEKTVCVKTNFVIGILSK